MWFVTLYCSALIGAAQPCDVYPNSDMTTFHSRIAFNNPIMCQRVADNVARADELRTGNLYAGECVKHDH